MYKIKYKIIILSSHKCIAIESDDDSNPLNVNRHADISRVFIRRHGFASSFSFSQ